MEDGSAGIGRLERSSGKVYVEYGYFGRYKALSCSYVDDEGKIYHAVADIFFQED